MLSLHSISQLNVFLHGVLFARSLEAVPRVPFGLALEVQHAGSVSVAVPHGGLLVILVQVKQLLVAQGLVDLVVHGAHSGLELGLHFLCVCLVTGNNSNWCGER